MKLASASFILTILCLSAVPAYAQQVENGPNYESRISTLEDTSRALNGQLEQLNYAIHRLDQSLQRMQADYDARLSKLEALAAAQPPAPPPAPPAPPTAPAAQDSGNTAPVAGSLGAIKTQDGQVVGGIKNPKAPPLPDTPPDYGLTPQEQFDHAFGLLKQANYDEAEKAFKTFIEKNPKDKLVENAKYWYGDTLYVRGRFADATMAFADAFQQNPEGVKAPDSLLMLAMSLAATDKTQDACVALNELRSKYPNASTSVRSRAAGEQTKLKCVSH